MKNKAYAAPYLVWMVLFIIVPLALVIVFAFTDTAGNFTFDNFSAVLDLGRIFLRSFWLAQSGTCAHAPDPADVDELSAANLFAYPAD